MSFVIWAWISVVKDWWIYCLILPDSGFLWWGRRNLMICPRVMNINDMKSVTVWCSAEWCVLIWILRFLLFEDFFLFFLLGPLWVGLCFGSSIGLGLMDQLVPLLQLIFNCHQSRLPDLSDLSTWQWSLGGRWIFGNLFLQTPCCGLLEIFISP